MTIKEFYNAISGNYSEAVGRMMMDTLVKRFAKKFASDTSFEELKRNLEAGNVEEAFRAAHTLKGVCGNLAFTKLGDSASEITELLRAGNLPGAREYFAAVQADYSVVMGALQDLDP